MEVKPEHKHRLRTDHKHRSRDDYKGKNKSEQRPRRSGGHKKKKLAMVAGAREIDSSSFYSSSSSSDEEENRHKGKQSSKNINGMCFAAQGFYGMAHSSASKKSKNDDSDFGSKEEVNNDPSFLIAENARLNDLLDNHDDVLRKTNMEKREYRSFLGEAKEKVVELEFLLDDARAQIDSLKSAPIVTNEPECTDCSTFLGELTVLKERYASKVEELDMLRVELDEMKSRPSLLGACTSCLVLHEKLDLLFVYARHNPSSPVFPPQTDNFQKPIKFKNDLGNEFFWNKGEKPSEEKPEPIESPKPKPKPKPFHCEHCGRDGHLAKFCFRRKREERLVRELANKDRYHPSRGAPKPRLVPRREGMVRTIYPRERHEFVPRGERPHREGGRRVGFERGEFAGRSFARGQYEYGGNNRNFRSQRNYRPQSLLRGTRSPPRGHVGVPPRSDRMDFANPTFEQMTRH
jgi:hypothetical protein